MRITFVFHSCFVLETEDSILVFDYWMDPKGIMERYMNSPKRMYVFSSHFHEDHFNRDIFKWRSRRNSGDTIYILSKDILRHRRASKEDDAIFMAKGSEWTDKLLRVTATGSTDIGVSWIVETNGLRIFHAGDLNNWYARFLQECPPGKKVIATETGEEIDPWKEDKRYLGELKDILKHTDRFDIVFFPIDSRIGNGYTHGARQFIGKFSTGLFIPMHFTLGGPSSAWRMSEYTEPLGIGFWKIQQEGDEMTWQQKGHRFPSDDLF